MSPVQDVSDEELSSLTVSILTRYGIDFTCYEPKSLKRRIIRILNRFSLNSVYDLWVQFLKDSDFLQKFMNEVSVGMTSMFRDPILWKKLPGHISNQFGGKSLNVWHAGCSTGEEVYSFGILLKELNLQNKTKAIATDFNSDAIDEAKKGIYHKIKMIENETNYKKSNGMGDFSRYYTSDTHHHAIMNRDLIKHASFSQQNLVTDVYPTGFDIVFCRNVMIYFDSAMKTKMLQKFHRSLNPGGILIIGFFDTISLLIENQNFKFLDEEAKIFQKQ